MVTVTRIIGDMARIKNTCGTGAAGGAVSAGGTVAELAACAYDRAVADRAVAVGVVGVGAGVEVVGGGVGVMLLCFVCR